VPAWVIGILPFLLLESSFNRISKSITICSIVADDQRGSPAAKWEGNMSLARAPVTFIAGLVVLLLVAGPRARAGSDYPNRPIHIIVPYPAGGIVDIVARAVTEQIGRDWKQAIVVEARPGANGNIGTAAVARRDPDGYGTAVLVNPTLYKDAGWDPMQSFKCVGLAVWNQSVAVVHPSMPVKTLDEFVELAPSKPGELNFGDPSTGSSMDLTAQKAVPGSSHQTGQYWLQGPAAGAG
jgi:tripartite-type tricarboxylate transporter receptor subunit TctC